MIQYTGNQTNVTVPSVLDGITVVSIGKEAFENSSITHIALPSTITTIDDSAFKYCRNLEYIYAPNVTNIGTSSFEYCSALTGIYDVHPVDDTVGAYFPNLISTKGYTFNNCKNLTTAYFKPTTPPSVNSVDTGGYSMYVFGYYSTAITLIYVPMESVSAYKESKSWGQYKSRIFGYNFEE